MIFFFLQKISGSLSDFPKDDFVGDTSKKSVGEGDSTNNF